MLPRIDEVGSPHSDGADARKGTSVAHVIACGDVISGCAAVFEGADEEDLLAQVGRHAAEDHGIAEIAPGVLDAVRAAIRVA